MKPFTTEELFIKKYGGHVKDSESYKTSSFSDSVAPKYHSTSSYLALETLVSEFNRTNVTLTFDLMALHQNNLSEITLHPSSAASADTVWAKLFTNLLESLGALGHTFTNAEIKYRLSKKEGKFKIIKKQFNLAEKAQCLQILEREAKKNNTSYAPEIKLLYTNGLVITLSLETWISTPENILNSFTFAHQAAGVYKGHFIRNRYALRSVQTGSLGVNNIVQFADKPHKFLESCLKEIHRFPATGGYNIAKKADKLFKSKYLFERKPKNTHRSRNGIAARDIPEESAEMLRATYGEFQLYYAGADWPGGSTNE